jgi:hypothetical protein
MKLRLLLYELTKLDSISDEEFDELTIVCTI